MSSNDMSGDPPPRPPADPASEAAGTDPVLPLPGSGGSARAMWVGSRPGWVQAGWWDAPLRPAVRALLDVPLGPDLVTALLGLDPQSRWRCPDPHVEHPSYLRPTGRSGSPCACMTVVCAAWAAVASWIDHQATVAVAAAAGATVQVVDWDRDDPRMGTVVDPAVDELAPALRVSPRGARTRVQSARALIARPALSAAVEQGLVTGFMARAVTCDLHELTRDAPARADLVVDILIEKLRARHVTGARAWTITEVRQCLTRIAASLHVDLRATRQRAKTGRRVTMTRDGRVGTIIADLPDDVAVRIMDRLHDLAHHLTDPDDDRTADHKRADVFTDLLLDQAASRATAVSGPKSGSGSGCDSGSAQAQTQARGTQRRRSRRHRQTRTPPQDRALIWARAAIQARGRSTGRRQAHRRSQPRTPTQPQGRTRARVQARAQAATRPQARFGPGFRPGLWFWFWSGSRPPRVTPGRGEVAVVIDAATLLALADHAGEIPGCGPIPAEIARELAADRKWRWWITEPTTAHVTATSARTYTPSAALARLIRAREPYCRMPGCRAPAHRCDLDHTVPWPDGDTTADNLGPVCRRHHNLKTHRHWKLTNNGPHGHSPDSDRPYGHSPDGHTPDGDSPSGWTWATPTGITHHDIPEHPLRT
ncbi:MAG: hypothetical protein V9E98_09570 [Candidatus Nanopelagicales bacterium]